MTFFPYYSYSATINSSTNKIYNIVTNLHTSWKYQRNHETNMSTINHLINLSTSILYSFIQDTYQKNYLCTSNLNYIHTTVHPVHNVYYTYLFYIYTTMKLMH
jgi:hypothetical protein